MATFNDLDEVPNSLPRPEMPMLRLLPSLMVPALSLAFVGFLRWSGSSYPHAFDPIGAHDAERSLKPLGMAEKDSPWMTEKGPRRRFMLTTH
jgi:hypothetical protein